jgi:hypothetical protein
MVVPWLSPREAVFLANLERSIRKEDFRAIADACEQLPSNDLALENPKIRSFLGQAYSALGGNYREKVGCEYVPDFLSDRASECSHAGQ